MRYETPLLVLSGRSILAGTQLLILILLILIAVIGASFEHRSNMGGDMVIKLIVQLIALIASIAGAVASVVWLPQIPGTWVLGQQVLSGFLFLIAVVGVWMVISSGMHKVAKYFWVIVVLFFVGLVAMLLLGDTY